MADRLRVTELDFDTIKNNLKNFLNQQTEFTDYDFEGSSLSILLDILAYNTHYNAYYLNMVANEAFMDTALLRDSVVSHAKTLGYVPYSQRAPIASVNVSVQSTTTTPGTLTLPRGFSFLSNQIDNTTYNFVVLDDITVTKANSSYFFEQLDIAEGQLITYNFSYDQATNPKQIFTLPDANIDTTTIKVTSVPSVGNTQVTVYNQVSDVLDVSATSEVYYLQENKNGKYQIYFGNNIIGKKLPDGAVVSITYLITNGSVANKANNFIATASATDTNAESITNYVITPVSAAAGGSVRESIDEIKFSAAAQFTTQNRLVTYKDYETYIKKNYPSVESISVWGGEDETPPAFGKVYISLKPKNNYFISEAEKERIITEIIEPKSIVTVGAEIRDPEFLYLLVNNYVEYEKARTTQSEEAIRTAIRQAIISYNNTFLNKFDATFVLSKLQDNVDAVDLNAIRGSETKLKVQKRFSADLSTSKTYTVNFNTELHRGTITEGLSSSEFDVFDNVGARRTVRLEEIPNSFTGVTEILVTDAGSGYTTQPIVTITGDGIGATAVAKVSNRRIESIQITNRGTGYTRALATISGGNGFGATAIVVLDARFGSLRTFYYDEDANKQIVDADAGTIDYDSGIVTLSDLRVLSVNTPDEFIRLTIEAEKGIISSVRNTIISIDDTDPASIVTELSQI
jgi:hypothetical protein